MSFLPATGHVVPDPQQDRLDEWLRVRQEKNHGLMIVGGWEDTWGEASEEAIDGVAVRYGRLRLWYAHTLAQAIQYTTGAWCEWQDCETVFPHDACAEDALRFCDGTCEMGFVPMPEGEGTKWGMVVQRVRAGQYNPLDSVITRDAELTPLSRAIAISPPST